ncbi:Golgi to ER traffic protein 4 homolog B-like, partial [Diaphorina citri]|uniref:Golgi to ER traffic protein 4 homolog B-like n=1 Tax=Diaphorina citri TaxID=121845 RepID=A0A1S3DLP1_DIACI
NNYVLARYHFLHSTDGRNFALMLIQVHRERGYANEIDSSSEYDWVSDGPLYDSGFIDNDGPLKKKLHPPQLSLELLSLPIGFPESIQGNILSSIMNNLEDSNDFDDDEDNRPQSLYLNQKKYSDLLDLLFDGAEWLWPLKVIETGKLVAFNTLCQQYQTSIKRDPAYSDYLNKIGHIFFGIQPARPAAPAGGLFGNILSSIMNNLEDSNDFDDDEDNRPQSLRN